METTATGKITANDLYRIACKKLPSEDIDHYRSDLYIRVSNESRKLIDSYEYAKQVQIFKSNIDGKAWYEIPFGYPPFWMTHEVRKGVKHR